MINILLGASGGGKSFEAVVYHIIPALHAGRKVITNMPLVIEEFARLNPAFPSLIDLRQQNVMRFREVKRWNFRAGRHDVETVEVSCRPFSDIGDYGDTWRHPVSGGGALYVIDECHKALPAKGTSVLVEEWFAEHRHELADVLLITQSAGKVSKAVMDNLQVVYRVRKATALGSEKSYIRKVQDGLRGDVVNETIRRYRPQFFKFYKSHTRSDGAGSELAAVDIIPFWKRWPVIGAGVCLVGVVYMLTFGHASLNPMKSAQASVQPLPAVDNRKVLPPPPGVVVPLPVVVAASDVPAVKTIAQAGKNVQSHPFEGLSIHIIGFVENSKMWRYSFSADQNGQPVFMMTQDHLEQSGYKVEKLSECSARIRYNELAFFATCDIRSVGMAPHGMVGS